MALDLVALGVALQNQGGSGDIIDVTELPVSGIDQDKVYRVTTVGESVTEIWHSVSPDIIESLGLSGILEPLTRNDVYIKTLAALDGGDVEYELHVVDTLPDVGVPSVPGQSFHVYVVNDESSEAFCFMDGSGWVPGSALDFGSYLGTVDDMADVKEAPEYMGAYYILKETRAGSTSYGIPNEAGTKKAYEHTSATGWTEFGGDIIDVTELPTENIEQDKVYRITMAGDASAIVWLVMSSYGLNGEFGEALSAMGEMQCNYFIVDSMPEAIEPSVMGVMGQSASIVNVYMVRGVWEPVYSLDGTTIQPLSNRMGGTWHGAITDTSEATADGLYTVLSEGVSSITYGIPNEEGAKKVYEHTSANGWRQYGFGGGSDGTGNDSIVVDVEALPTENIDDSKIYRVYNNSVMCWIVYSAAGMNGDMGALMGGSTINYIVVDTLPTSFEPSVGQTAYVYLVRGEWVPMMSQDGTTTLSVHTMLGLDFKGVINDSSEATEDGVYTIINSSTSYGIPNGDGQKKLFEYGTEWIDIGETITSLKEERATLNVKVESLEQTIEEIEPYANFTKYAQFSVKSSNVSVSGWRNIKGVRKINIPEGIGCLGEYAFISCEDLENVTLPEGLIRIDTSAFSYTKLESVIIPNTVSYIGGSAFEGMGGTQLYPRFETLQIPSGVKEIFFNTFAQCYLLKTITFQGVLTSIGSEAFGRCQSLERINYAGTKAQWKAITFGTDWDAETGNYTVYCTDGTIAKDGTET